VFNEKLGIKTFSKDKDNDDSTEEIFLSLNHRDKHSEYDSERHLIEFHLLIVLL
jgi:hypothetical protein